MARRCPGLLRADEAALPDTREAHEGLQEARQAWKRPGEAGKGGGLKARKRDLGATG